jgi:hypothetical protein
MPIDLLLKSFLFLAGWLWHLFHNNWVVVFDSIFCVWILAKFHWLLSTNRYLGRAVYTTAKHLKKLFDTQSRRWHSTELCICCCNWLHGFKGWCEEVWCRLRSCYRLVIAVLIFASYCHSKISHNLLFILIFYIKVQYSRLEPCRKHVNGMLHAVYIRAVCLPR